MIPHIHTLFEFISIPYENQHQTLTGAKSSFESIQLHYCNQTLSDTVIDRVQVWGIGSNAVVFIVRRINKFDLS